MVKIPANGWSVPVPALIVLTRDVLVFTAQRFLKIPQGRKEHKAQNRGSG